MPSKPLQWNGAEVEKQLVRRLTKALNEIDARIRLRAKEELKRGRGLRTGKLKRSIRYVPAKRDGLRIIGAVRMGRYHSTFVHEGVKAMMRISKSGKAYYHRGQSGIPYLVIGFNHVKPQAGEIIAKHVGA